ncbi:MAG TPA: AAA family ATPase [Candidatus Binatia bacterium]|jgi:DNA-binding winged helix-turn-helix (wHTH) protein/predicted ATPase
MTEARQILFGPFRLDTSTGSIGQGSKVIPLRPKSLGLLRYLLEHPNRLLTKEELVRAVWPDAKVVSASLKVSIREIRQKLADVAGAPKFIETVGRDGYRFIAPVTVQLLQSDDLAVENAKTYMVGRQTDLRQLNESLEKARSGRRQIIFITGEAGIGKTTLLESFSRGLLDRSGVLFSQGQCVEQYGAGEPYLPVLEALERLLRISDRSLELLRQFAPSWLVNLPAFTDPAERSALEQRRIGITPKRMLREFAGFLEALARDQTVLLSLEDLHWADSSTLSLISFLARRAEPARLALVATYRNPEPLGRNHPVRELHRELQLHGHSRHLSLAPLNESAVGEYLHARFAGNRISQKLMSAVHLRSEGNPLFMVTVTDFLLMHENIQIDKEILELAHEIEQSSVPATIRQLTEAQLDGLLAREQELLKVASVAGVSFSTALLAAGMEHSLEWIEAQAENLARQGLFLQARGIEKWPDGTSASRYAFRHALYQNVIYNGQTTFKKARLHQLIGERLESGYKAATDDVAAELALHFERAGAENLAIKYFVQAAQKALRNCAYQEAIGYADTGLKLLESLPPNQSREWELILQFVKGIAFASAKGYASAESNEPFSRARMLSEEVRNDSIVFQTFAGLWSFHIVRADLTSALDLGQQMLRMSRRTRNPIFFRIAHMATGIVFFYLGDLIAARHHLEKSCRSFDREIPNFDTSVYGWDPENIVLCYSAQAYRLLGELRKAQGAEKRAIERARELRSPFHEAFAGALLSVYYGYCGYEKEALHSAETALLISNEGGFEHPLALATVLRGWALAKTGYQSEGILLIEAGKAKWKATGAQLGMPIFLALEAEVFLDSGRIQEGLASIEEGLATSRKNHDCNYDAELYRLKGELLMRFANHKSTNGWTGQAEECFRRAIQTARRQKARSLELKATMSLGRLRRSQGRRKEAKAMVTKIYNWFTKDFEAPLLLDARKLINELAKP